MALIDMASELSEAIPSLDRVYAKTLVKRAYRYVCDSNLWSFQLAQGGFSTPNITTAGSISIPGGINSNTIVGDATASAAWTALPFYFSPTVQQIRANGYSIYSIIAIDTTNPNAVVLTLDRPFIDPLVSYTGVGYQMFQAYIAAPKGFKRWLNIADMFNCWSLDIWTSRRTVNMVDPARLYTSNPICVFGLGADQRGYGTPNASSTIGQQLYELYPNPSTAISYQTYYVWEGPDLVNNSDTVPFPITQDVVLEKAKTYAYEWAEARKDVMAAKGSGANYVTLKRDAEATFQSRLKSLRLLDKDAVDAFNINMGGFMQRYRMPYFNSPAGRANMGA
ncbi:MAG: hypothetical protein KGL39_19210 [Patescibacteria group bacterium]|nr:hypothetical protein [Patescibacteria group bacterium]